MRNLLPIVSTFYLYYPLLLMAILQVFSVAWLRGRLAGAEQSFHRSSECVAVPVFLGLLMALCRYFLQSCAPHLPELLGTATEGQINLSSGQLYLEDAVALTRIAGLYSNYRTVLDTTVWNLHISGSMLLWKKQNGKEDLFNEKSSFSYFSDKYLTKFGQMFISCMN